MGRPEKFGVELPKRCWTLIENLWQAASEILPEGQRYEGLGPLTSTFLLSMSMPILNVPIERMEREDVGGIRNFIDQGEYLADYVHKFREITKLKLQETSFFEGIDWRYVRIGPEFDFSYEFPECIASDLDGDFANSESGKLRVSQWLSILRNALAHGGIVYLNEAGRSVFGEGVTKYAFVSSKYSRIKCGGNPDKNCPTLIDGIEYVNVIRISTADYREFLKRWVLWLTEEDDGKR